MRKKIGEANKNATKAEKLAFLHKRELFRPRNLKYGSGWRPLRGFFSPAWKRRDGEGEKTETRIPSSHNFSPAPGESRKRKKEMLFIALVVACLVAFSSGATILAEDYQRPAITLAMVEEINVSVWLGERFRNYHELKAAFDAGR